MAGPRSKRKRSEVDSTPGSSRRKVREPAGFGPEPTDEKNEEIENLDMEGEVKQSPSVQRGAPRGSNTISSLNEIAVEDGNDHVEEKSSKEISSGPAHGVSNNKSDIPCEEDAVKFSSAELIDTFSNFHSKEDREKQIRKLLMHRKLLLQRARMVRTAANRRLKMQLNEEGMPKTDDEEIAAFLQMTREANSLARKMSRADPESTSAEKRTSVSLRRGATVGKRMNAALSSLAPGSANTATEEITNETTRPKLPIRTTPDVIGPQISVQIAPDTMPAGPAKLVTTPAPPKPNVPSVPKMVSAPARPVNKPPKTTHQALSRNPKQRGLSPAMQIAGHVGKDGPIVQLQMRLPNVVFPEAQRLRERRSEIRSKLSSMLYKRHKQDGLNVTEAGSQIKLSSTNRSTRTLSPSSIKTLISGPGEPSFLPQRRKTHWDYVLEEMRWLASDFIEERKWKVATCKVLAAALCEHTDNLRDERMHKGLDTVEVEGDPKVDHKGSNENVDVNKIDVEEKKIEAIKKADCNNASIREYQNPSEECMIAQRSVALRLASQCYDAMVCSSSQVGGKAENGETHSALENTIQPLVATKSNDTGEHEASNLSIEKVDTDEADEDSVRKERSEILAGITEHVDSLLEKVKKISFRSKPSSPNIKSHGVGLSTGQIKLLETIEEFWGKADVGCMLTGPLASGKTVAVCSILWRRRESGPQLLVCSPASLIRWLHELGRFSDVACRTVDDLANEDFSISEKDVLICDYGAVYHLAKDLMQHFCSIIVDCRHPNGFSGSRLPLVENFANTDFTPSELLSTSWWKLIANDLSNKPARRLVIDTCDWELTVRSLRSLPIRTRLEVQVLRLFFLIGVGSFVVNGTMIPKLLLAWFRKRIKGTAENTLKHVRVEQTIREIAENFMCRVQNPKMLESTSIPRSSNVSWDLQRCEMQASQRNAYEDVCLEARSSLSILGESGDDFDSVANSFLRLRRQCFHGNVEKMLKVFFESPRRERSGFHSASQPDVELARRLLEGSAKLQHLLMILADEFGLAFVGRAELEDLLPKETWKRPQKDKGKLSIVGVRRIAILANLPEIQVLVSGLLNAVGIRHDLLLKPSGINASCASDIKLATALRWAEIQLVLAKFNQGTSFEEAATGEDIRIVVGSIATVASDHCGVGIERADLVAILDEDWSGRDELLMRALVARCLCRKECLKDEPCRFVRIVAEDSCEDKFLAQSVASLSYADTGRKLGEIEKWPLPTSQIGSFEIPFRGNNLGIDIYRQSWTLRHPSTDTFAFLGANIFCHRGSGLSDVMATSEELPPLFYSGESLQFLPVGTDEDTVAIEINVLAALMRREDSAAQKYHSPERGRKPSFNRLGIGSFSDFLASRKRYCLAKVNFFQQSVLDASSWIDDEKNSQVNVLDFPRKQEAVISNALRDEVASYATDTADCGVAVDKFLFYTSKEFALTCGSGSDLSLLKARRANLYSSSFASCRDESLNLDGHRGDDALVLFPPIFPKMIESYDSAKADILARDRTMMSSRKAAPSLVENQAGKRPSNFQPDVVCHKRSRIEVTDSSITNKPDSLLVTEDEASHSDAASVLADLADDYGLAGLGCVPFPRDSAVTAGFMRTATVSGPPSLSPILEDPKDVEHERNAQSSLVLFVPRKRSRYSGMPARPRPPSLSTISTPGVGWNGLHAPSNQTGGNGLHEINGGKKLKKKSQTLSDIAALPSSAFNRLPYTESSHNPQSLGLQVGSGFNGAKDMYRKQLLSSARHSGLGTTLFEYPLFRKASISVQERVSLRMLHRCWTSSSAYEAGPGLPLIVFKQFRQSSSHDMFDEQPVWTSVVKRLRSRSSSTGDEAVEQARSQITTLRRSLVSPYRVDFGPFQTGFLSSTSGMTSVPLARNRPGVSLPMGVKILSKEHTQPVWTPEADELLEQAVLRFGPNWMVCARWISGFQDVVHHQANSGQLVRGGRSCRDRWQHIIRNRPDLARKVREVSCPRVDEGDLPPVQAFEGSSVGLGGVQVLLANLSESSRRGVKVAGKVDARSQPKSIEEEDRKVKTDNSTGDARGPPRRSFSAFLSAKKKVQTKPMTIPGIAPGATTPSISQVHPSHLQAIQSAAWPAGRTEMWPLQILDAAERQRTGTNASTASTATRSSSATRHHSNSASGINSRPPSVAQSARISSSSAPTIGSSGQQGSSASPGQQASSRSDSKTATVQSFAPPQTTASSPKPKADDKGSSA